jgi:imidazole glycerol phosphate synthase glutamine amidotransferase subunit
VKLALIDYGAGNLPSVERALARLGVAAVRVDAASKLDGTDSIVLPGVGHFASMLRTLRERDLLAPLRERIGRGMPFLGICLGLQALYESSDEAVSERGLGVLRGQVRLLPASVKVPHIGWDQLRPLRPSRLLGGVDRDAYFYFAHSFAATVADGEVAAVCDYGAEFAAAIERNNLFAVQFHPEKSGEAGATVLANFLEAAR